MAVVGDAAAHAFEEGRQVVAVPFLECVAGVGVSSASTLISQHCDLIYQVGMLWPTGRDGVDWVEDILVVYPGNDGVKPSPQFRA